MIYSFSKNETIEELCHQAEQKRLDCLRIPFSLHNLQRLAHMQEERLITSLQRLSFSVGTGHPSPSNEIDIQNFLLDLRYNWGGNTDRKIVVTDIRKVLTLFNQHDAPSSVEIEQILNFVQSNNDHPLINASLLYVSVISILPQDPYAAIKASLCSRYALARSGFDIFGSLIYEDALLESKEKYIDVLSSLNKTGNATHWIAFMISIYLSSLTSLEVHMKRESEHVSQQGRILTQRQISIVSLFTSENIMLSNKEIRAVLKLSPITTARELALLVKQAYLIPIGRGRSIRYTKNI